MKSILPALVSLVFATTAHAQWMTTTYTLKGGWNSIYLTGDASYDTIDALLPSTVLEVWRWNPNPHQVGFIDTPMIPSSGTAEWSVWKRGLPAESSLMQLSGQTAYLVKCSGNASQSYSVGLKQLPQLPTNSWVRNGANLLGFPALKNGSTYPTMASYFATFPAAIAASAKVYKYVGGDLGAGNPLQVFSPNSERLDATQAYWFSAEVTGNYYAPLEISVSTGSGGLDFGRTGSTVTMRLRNRSAAAVTVTLAPVVSDSAPATQTPVTGSVALTRRSFNAVTGSWTETALSTASTESIGANSTVELSFGINRAGMTGAADAFYASLLRLTESSNLMDVYLPVSAKKASLAGLWVGDISLNSVSSKVSNRAQATASVAGGSVTGLTVTGSGGGGYTSAPAVTLSAPPSNGNSTATATATRSAGGTITALTSSSVGGGYTSAPVVTIGPPGSGGQQATATAILTNGTVSGYTITNPGSGYQLPGVRYDYYEGTWSALPDFNSLIPVRSGVTGTFNLGGRLRDDNFAMRFQATLSTPLAGSYTFYTASDDGSRLLVDGTVVVNNDGLHGDSEQQGTVTLTAGVHDIEVQYFEGLGNEVLVASYAGPGLARQVIPQSVLVPGTPSVTVGSPVFNQQATATATLTNGSVTGLTLTNGGSGYTLAPSVTLEAPPALSGTAASGTYSVRVLLHVSDNGTARLLPKVYLGKLAAGSNEFGICTSQSLLQSTALASARRLSSAHLPFGPVITGSGAVALGGQLTCTITLPYNASVNPFVHQFHPDHDNRNATFDTTLSEGVESYTVTRVGTFDFATTPPAGSSVTSGWGSSVLGGTYSEILSGLHSSSIQIGGTFELRRASELGTLSQ